MPERSYPIRPCPDDDARFTRGLMHDLARVLADHGYPSVEHGLDLVDLRQALFGFLYSDRDLMRPVVAERGERPLLDPRSFDRPGQRAAARMLNADAAERGDR